MEKYVISSDGCRIHYLETGESHVALVLVHGWLGNAHWWANQPEYFKNQ